MSRQRSTFDIARKVTGATLGVALATIAIYAVEATFGIDLPKHVEDAVQVLATFGGGYVTRSE